MMRKTRFLLVLICISTVLFSAGCGAQKTSTVPLKEIINLSESDISSIGTSEGGGLQTTIQDSTQIKIHRRSRWYFKSGYNPPLLAAIAMAGTI
ncbi:MAG: hypothetical protein E6579_07080 [Clostridium sp.]|nr:hypothetical protein [Clostridium sp.]MDU6345106.1 hypothetical protein [Clostridium sp.]